MKKVICCSPGIEEITRGKNQDSGWGLRDPSEPFSLTKVKHCVHGSYFFFFGVGQRTLPFLRTLLPGNKLGTSITRFPHVDYRFI